MPLRNAKFDSSDKILAIIVSLRNLLAWLVSAFSSREVTLS
jgi:hypothetical protein